MKKIAILTIVFLLCVQTGSFPFFYRHPLRSAAEETRDVYACVLSHDVYLYEEENESSGLFRIPYTYYVKVIASGLEYSYVQYSTDNAPFQAIYGYCKTDELHFVDFVPARPFLYYTLDVTYRLEDYSDFFNRDDVFSSVTLTYAYYGDYTVGSSTYCYVCLDGKKGYLPKTMDVSYELNNDYQASVPDASDPSPSESVPFPTGQIVFAAIMAVLGLGIAYYLLHPRRSAADVPGEEFEA